MRVEMIPEFSRKIAQANQFRIVEQEVCDAIQLRLRAQCQTIPGHDEQLHKLDVEYDIMRKGMVEAFDRLLDGLFRPTLTFATTGTTSSGKSALVNLLCGAAIMPVSQDELSAGVVEIIHGESRTLTVLPTNGASWETGEWPGLSDTEIQDRLEAIMRKYNEHRHEPNSPDCPSSKLVYPTRIGAMTEELGLPPGCRVRLLDLPGLKYIGDDINSRIIKQESRRAVCFVAYNSEETEERKQDALLDQVVAQVKQMGGSPSRMLFVLNRIDAFRRDVKSGGDWKDREDHFVEVISGRIRRTLSERLPEYAEDVAKVRIIRLSTKPALLALDAQGVAEKKRVEALQQINEMFRSLVPKDVRNNVAREFEDCTIDQAAAIGRAVWKSSYGEALMESLREHITSHFPDLVIPSVTDLFRAEAAGPVVEWAVQTCEAQIKGSSDQYEVECARIKLMRQRLFEICAEGSRQFRAPFERIRSIADSRPADAVIETRNEIERLDDHPLFMAMFRPDAGGSAASTLHPLHGWLNAVNQVNEQIFEAVATVLESRPSNAVDILSPRATHALHVTCNELRRAGYSEHMARNGCRFDTKDPAEQSRLSAINGLLNQLAGILPDLLKGAMNQALSGETIRVHTAVQKLVDLYWRLITSESQIVAPDIGLTVPSESVRKVEFNLDLTYSFQAGFPIKIRHEQEWAGTKQVKTGKRRAWWTLWLMEVDVMETQDVYERRRYDSADIPSVETMLKGWVIQASKQEPAMVQKFGNWILDRLNDAATKVDDLQQKLLDRYQVRLDEAHRSATTSYAEAVELWGGVRDRAKDLENSLNALCASPRKASEDAQ